MNSIESYYLNRLIMAKGDQPHSTPLTPQTTDCQLNITIQNGSGACVKLITDLFGSYAGMEDPNYPGRFSIRVTAGGGTGSSIYISKDGYNTITHRLADTNGDPLEIPFSGSTEIRGETLVAVFPERPTRDKVLDFRIKFQGNVVQVDGIGLLPWFTTALQCLNPTQRKQVYPQLASDTHIIIEFLPAESIYNEPGQPYQSFISPNFEANPQAFLELVEEIIIAGFIPAIAYNGDNADNPVDGYPNALRQLPILNILLASSKYRDLNQDVLFLRFWDGVFYGSTPENIQNFGTEFRKLNPNGYLGIEFQPGKIPAGEGGNDYKPGGRMDGYDIIFAEFSDDQLAGLPDAPTSGNDTIWQIFGRCVRPYNRDPNQPANDDPNPPFYLVDSPRGPRKFVAFEGGFKYGEYPWVRVDMNNYQPLQSLISQRREYFKQLGAVCWG